ncbi:hypothetical protein BMF94_3295 [Rhodotorula taiwanensis]|uniref:Uncharacterized protein n=1 Tax=Rhodotorula taiwanensis TaxID=741276 RepID=A0A2S5BAH2_9BASI|nr:hypothetical protein BMF94_3295 [Rhodotorula taiwanensis]
MLDRLPADLLERVVDAMSHSIWTRKAALDRLGLVSTSYRRATASISTKIVCVDRASATSIIKKWPATRRRQVTTLLVGSFEPKAKVSLPGTSHAQGVHQLLAVLPNVKDLYLRKVDLGPDRTQLSILDWYHGTAPPRLLDFCLNAENPFQKCLSLSMRAMRVKYFNSIDPNTATLFNRLLSRDCLPHLELLRLSGQSLPACTKAFLDSLRAIQVDLSPDLEYHVEEGGAFFETSTPILFAMDPPPGASFAGLIADHLRYLEIQTSEIPLLNTTRLPEIKRIFCTIVSDEASLSDDRAPLEAKRHELEQYLEAAAAVGHASPVHVTHDCPATYEFVQSAFLQHRGIGNDNA